MLANVHEGEFEAVRLSERVLQRRIKGIQIGPGAPNQNVPEMTLCPHTEILEDEPDAEILLGIVKLE